MGLLITGDDTGPIPRRTKLTLECAHRADFSCRGAEIFNAGSHVENMAAATRAGWVERYTSEGRIFVCKECA